jgi:hypothetical protein
MPILRCWNYNTHFKAGVITILHKITENTFEMNRKIEVVSKENKNFTKN